MAEEAIKALEAKANKLIEEQNAQPKNPLTLPEKEGHKQSRKANKQPNVIKSIGVGGTSIFSAEITNKKHEPDVPPHIQFM